LLRVHVFTTEIYHQLNTRFDQSAAAMLSFVLVLITLAVLVGQRILLGQRSYVTVTGTARVARPIPLGRWRWPAFALAGGILGLSVLLPIGVLLSQARSAGQFAEVFQEQWRFFTNSLWTAGLAATVAMVIGLLVAYTAQRAKGRIGAGLSGTVQIGYAIPGTVLGLSLILLYNTYLPWLYGTVGVLVLAYLIRFLTQSMQGVEAALRGINPHLEEAGRSLAASPGAVLRRILAPLVRPTLLAVWALVFISSMKELDATLLLRPAGFDTLPVRVYIHTVEAEYAKAAVLSLLLIAFTAMPWLALTRLREKKLV
jgi:iron(III) transport system permease protein